MSSQAKQNVIKRAAAFFQETKLEILKIVWPSRQETTMTAFVVFLFCVIMAIYFLIVDNIIGFIIRKILGLGD